MRIFPSLLLALCPIASATGQTKDGLESRLRPLIQAHQGKVAVAVKELATGETYYHNADEVMPTASLIKLPILIEVLTQVRDDKVALDAKVTLREEDKVPGSGILTKHFSEGAVFPLRDAVHLMIAFSDNTATNLVLDKIGIRSVNERMQAWGLKETRLNAKVFRGSTTSVDPERTRKYGLGSTTAREMVDLLEMLETGNKLQSSVLKQFALAQLKQCESTTKFSRFLPKDVVLAHKTGEVSNARTDAGIFYFDNTAVAICVLTADNQDKSWGSTNAGDLLCAKVAEITIGYFRSR